jgi:hypothetical protein
MHFSKKLTHLCGFKTATTRIRGALQVPYSSSKYKLSQLCLADVVMPVRVTRCCVAVSSQGTLGSWNHHWPVEAKT